MNFDFTSSTNQKLDATKPFCDKCYENLIAKRVPHDKGVTIYQECPKCHKQWIFECDGNGNLLSTKVIEVRR